ncbi:hypothetical protein DFR86_05115 [Acidianus sulfidivorans JP7]|uniref:Uncharacterized protein n=1 Tax=Acidianus sulfidivorans JP7 TaxID=619593 RepID=A0A2U9ILW8_9CREN|nr:hypothetical protein [Acidianus sulfidivorans]AWR97000.1 hypothetical protein DFR86_05115 [Acidianus sulfidivorans JP7]
MGFLDCYVNFAAILGKLLSKYPDDVADLIEDAVYKYGAEYACADENECYEELSRVIKDFARALGSDKEEVVRFCRDSATYVNESCFNKCVPKVYEDISKNTNLRNMYSLNDKDFMSMAMVQCDAICTKFNVEKYEECIERLFPRKKSHTEESP